MYIKANLIKPMNVEVKLRKPRNQSLTMTMYSTVDVEPAMSGRRRQKEYVL